MAEFYEQESMQMHDGQSTVSQKAEARYKPVNSDGEYAITSLSDLAAISRGSIVRLPDFAEGAPFIVRMKRPSMMQMAMAGKIPNRLLTKANELFLGGSIGNKEDEAAMKEIFELMEIICNAALVEPSYDEIKAAGLVLSDEQYIAIFNYTQEGVKSLESFRSE